MSKRMREKLTDWGALWRDFMSSSEIEKTPEEEILTSTQISDEDKKELLKALNSNEKLINRMFKNQYKTSIPKVKHKEVAKKAVNEYYDNKSENNQEKISNGREPLDD